MNIVEFKNLDRSRKIDNAGRIGIPKVIRDEYKIADGDECEFCYMKTDEGRAYLCYEIITDRRTPAEIEALIKGFQDYGIDVPADLWKQFQELRAKS